MASLSDHHIQHPQGTKKDPQLADIASKTSKPPKLKGRARTLARRAAAGVAETQHVMQKEEAVQNDYESPISIYQTLCWRSSQRRTSVPLSGRPRRAGQHTWGTGWSTIRNHIYERKSSESSNAGVLWATYSPQSKFKDYSL